MASSQPPRKITISSQIQPSVLRGKIADGCARAYHNPQSWKPIGLRSTKLMATVKESGIEIHLDSLRAGLRIPLHPFEM